MDSSESNIVLITLEQPHQSMQNSCLFCKKKHTFSISHTHFYKTLTSVYLFYHLFYLNNNISLIFIISNEPLPTWPHPPFSFFVVRRRQMREQPDREREKKKNKKIICKAVLYICIFLQVLMWVFLD